MNNIVSVDSALYLPVVLIMIKLRFLVYLRNNGNGPPACYFASVQDGKHEIYLECMHGLMHAACVCRCDIPA